MSDELTLKGASGDWVLVESEEKGRYYVAEVIVAGNTLEIGWGKLTLDARTWAIQGKEHPHLLVEAPSYYEPHGRTEERNNDVVFYSDE